MNAGVKRLSKNLLQMKFMKKTALQVEKDNAEEEVAHSDEHWYLKVEKFQQKKPKFVFDPNISLIEDLRFGRMSFLNANPDIERLMRSGEAVEQEEEEDVDGKDVTDKEMAERYSLAGTVAKKFARKRQKSEVDSEAEPVRKFLKPKLDD